MTLKTPLGEVEQGDERTRANMKTPDDTISVVRAYHRSWTSGKFEEAPRLLASDLQVEVPINEYPPKEPFAQALIRFRELVSGVALLAAFSHHNAAAFLSHLDADPPP